MRDIYRHRQWDVALLFELASPPSLVSRKLVSEINQISEKNKEN